MDVQTWFDETRAPAPARGALLFDIGRVSALERARVEDLRRHARRLAVLSAALGRRIDLAPVDLERLRIGSLLHDVGKAAIPAHILFKCGRLSAEEYTAVKLHPIIGDLLCARVPALAGIRPIVRHHHERLDGSGYPDGLAGDAIPLLAQLVGVVDVYDALVYCRSYKPAFDCDHAFSILEREADMGWRRQDLVDALIDVIQADDDLFLSAAAV